MKKHVLIFALFCLVSKSSYGSHIVGGDLYYNFVAGNIYQITLVLYGDCSVGSAAAASTFPSSGPQICIYDGATSVTSRILLYDSLSSNIEITVPCPGDTSQCTNPASVVPGVKKFVYRDTVTLPHTSAVWRFIYSGSNLPGASSGRAASITNVSSAASTIMQLVDTLNNSLYDNSSPSLAVSQKTFFCLLQHDTYNPAASDPDGDSLVLNMAPATNGSSSCGSVGGPVVYSGTIWPGGAPASYSYPVEVTTLDSFSFNSTNGNMFFKPLTQRAVVDYNIREYRSGVLVGTSQREMTVLVVNCDSTFPCLSTGPLVALGSALSEHKESEIETVTIFPNPATNELEVKSAAGIFESATISDASGRVLIRQRFGGTGKIAIGRLDPGLYYLWLNGASGYAVKKFLKM